MTISKYLRPENLSLKKIHSVSSDDTLALKQYA